MIVKKAIEDFLKKEFEGSDYFLVAVKTGRDDSIKVFVDSMKGLSIQECYDISRKITAHFDRDEEDYSLDVSSPGLDMPLSVPMQFEKNIDRAVQVILEDGSKITGILKAHDRDGIVLEVTSKIKVEGNKKKQEITESVNYNFKEIKAVKVVVSFK
jgi:ribosome maturation factor RimP